MNIFRYHKNIMLGLFMVSANVLPFFFFSFFTNLCEKEKKFYIFYLFCHLYGKLRLVCRFYASHKVVGHFYEGCEFGWPFYTGSGRSRFL